MKRLYIATPINSLKGDDLAEKKRKAQRRIKILKTVLADEEAFKDYELFSTFDLPHDDETTEARALGDCVTAVLNCDAIYMDHGWRSSKGCNLEYRAAKIYGKTIFEHDKL